jgi:xanthine dehydrogenase accessory factor
MSPSLRCVYRIALSVAACLRANTRVDVAWAVETNGLDVADRSDALAITPGGGRIGSLVSGALDSQLSDLASQGGSRGRLVDLQITDIDALVAGLPGGGRARCLLVQATSLPSELWDLLLARQPVCLVTGIEGDEVQDTALFDSVSIAAAGEPAAQLFNHRVSDAVVGADAVTTVLWPLTQLVIVGTGPIADAIAKAAALLGWQTQVVNDVATATGLIAGLAAPDKLVVAAHDVDVAGPALAAALSSDVGYIGALGAQRMQQVRAEWLAYRDITELDRIHGPAGLDIGAETPAEIALSVLAEAIAEKSASGER